jgi:hypothetical protein
MNQRFRGRFGLLIRLAFGINVTQLAVASLYAQDHFHSHILGRPCERPFQRRQERRCAAALP